jgi:hypothetical protein
VKVIATDLLAPEELVRHDSDRLARLVLSHMQLPYWEVG